MVAPSASVGPRPLVLVIHNYQGLKQFDRDVAEYFARLGYVGLAIDMYGDRVPSDEREFPTDPRGSRHFKQNVLRQWFGWTMILNCFGLC